jgi:hypothetical protein
VTEPPAPFAGLPRKLRAEARLRREKLAEAPGLSPQATSDLKRVFRDFQRERGGVIAGERVRDMKDPAGRVPGGVWCSGCRRDAHSADMTSLMAARAADWSAIFFPVA